MNGKGCVTNSLEMLQSSAYGPGPEYEINTERPFHVKESFKTDLHGELATIETILSQGDKA